MAAEGQWVQVVTAIGGKNLLRRLYAMGIIDGTELEIIHRNTDSGIVVRCGDTRWAINRGMAHKVMVVSIDKADSETADVSNN